MQTFKRFHRRYLPRPLELLLGLGLPFFVTLLAIAMESLSFRYLLGRFWDQPLLFLMNYIPVALVLWGLGALLGNLFWGASLTTLLFGGTSLACRIKISLRYEALYPRDFLLLREVGSALDSYDLDLRWDFIALILASVVALAVLGFLFRHRPWGSGRRRPLWRLLGCLSSLGLLAVLTLTVYASDTVYYGFETSNLYNHITVYNEYGFPYSFFHCFTAYSVDCPEGYRTQEAETWDSAETEATQGKPIHVILVMNEAFSSLTEADAFTFTQDPMENFHTLQASDRTISGHIVVANIGGGTSNTEFDVLTGIQADSLSPTTSIAFGAVTRNMDSLYRIFDDDGYATSFLHPSVGWFYNRENTYEKLGAQTQLYVEDMPDLQWKGSWPTDASVATYIEETFQDTVAAGQLMFSYTTTFQNHLSYRADKYGADYTIPALEVDRALSQEAKTAVSVYVEGIRDADAMLGELVDYFEAQEEPVILAFFGDHLPSLGTNNSAYAELGLDLESTSQDPAEFYYAYATPYLIWTNQAGADLLDWDTVTAQLDLPESGYLSACYLGEVLLELTGRGQENAWTAFLGDLRRELPVVRNGTYMTADGTITTTLPAGAQDLVLQWRRWSYYKLRHKDIS